MDWLSGTSTDVPSTKFAEPELESIEAGQASLTAFGRGQGLLSPSSLINVVDPSLEEAAVLLNLLNSLISQQHQDTFEREQLREQSRKDRFALTDEKKKNDDLNKKADAQTSQMKELHSKILKLTDDYKKEVLDLKAQLQSTKSHLNGVLGGKDAAAAKRAGGGGGTAGQRRNTLAYDRFKDDAPYEAVAKLETQLAAAKKEIARLKQQEAAAGRPPRLSIFPGARRDPSNDLSDGGMYDNSEASGPGSAYDMQAVRSALNAEVRRDLEAVGARTAAGLGPAPVDPEVLRLRNMAKSLDLNVQHLQRQLDKAISDKTELHKNLHALRSRCASLEVEKRNAEERCVRMQRAASTAADLAAAEEQAAAMRAQLEAKDQELRQATGRVAEVERQLSTAQANEIRALRHVEVLKRALKVVPAGVVALEQLERLVREEMEPVLERLRKAEADVAEARAEREAALARADAAAAAQASFGGAAAAATDTPLRGSGGGSQLPLTPVSELAPSPAVAFDFGIEPPPSLDSPRQVQQRPSRAAYHSTLAATMPSPQSRRASACASPPRDGAAHAQLLVGAVISGSEPGGNSGGGAAAAEPGSSGAAAAGPYWRRSMSAGVPRRSDLQYASTGRARWEVNPAAKQRYPSPCDLILEQWRSQQDTTITVATPSSGGAPVSMLLAASPTRPTPLALNFMQSQE